MNSTQQTQTASNTRYLKTGLFVVSIYIFVGTVLGYALGFGNPEATHAQLFDPAPIIVTAPAPTPIFTPPPVIIPPVFNILPPTLLLPTILTPTAPANQPTEDPEIVVTAPQDNSAETVDVPTYGPPCCTVPPVAVTTPATVTEPAEIIVTAPVAGTDVPTYGPPCCTIPTTPTVPVPVIPPVIPPTVPPIVPPPVLPPVIPPIIPLVAPECTLVAGPTSVQVGGASLLTWTTANATSFSINQGLGSLTPVSGGTATVTPATTTTYVGTATGSGGTVTCNATVTVTVAPPVPACVLSASATQVNLGESVTLSYSGTNISAVSIDQGVGALASTSGTVVVTPPGNTTYTGTFTTTSGGTLTCAAPVTIITGGGGGCTGDGCGGGGGSGGGGGTSSGGGRSGGRHSLVTLSSRPVLAPLGDVYLSQIPYTGLDLGTAGTIAYWSVLVIWSLAAAYLILFGLLPYTRRSLVSFSGNVKDNVSARNAGDHAPEAQIHETTMHASQPETTPARPGISYAPAPEVPVQAPAYDIPAPLPVTVSRKATTPGFASFATEGALTIDDIVKGLSRESGMVFSQTAPEDVVEQSITMTHEEIPSDAPAPLEHAPAVAPTPTPAPVRAAPAVAHAPAALAPEVPGFITALLAGERATVFNIIRTMNQAGHDVETFVSHAILALDDAYRARIDGTAVHPEIEQATAHLGTPFLEKFVASLTTAVDGSYSLGTTGIKLAITRALAVAEG